MSTVDHFISSSDKKRLDLFLIKSWQIELFVSSFETAPPPCRETIEKDKGWLTAALSSLEFHFLTVQRNTETLKHWNTETLKYWNTELLKYWNTEILKHWNTELLKYWSTEILKYCLILNYTFSLCTDLLLSTDYRVLFSPNSYTL